MPIEGGKIDYDRGVIINTHKDTGMDVFMYVDQPGHFLTAHGGVVPDIVAGQAGYDVEKLAKERLRQERKGAAMAAIDKELNDEKNIIEETVEERNGFKLISIGLGRHHVVDPDGNRLTQIPQPLDLANKLLDAMAGPKAVAAATSLGIGKKNG